MISLICIATFKGEILLVQQSRNDVSVDELRNVLTSITKKEPDLFAPCIRFNGTYGHYIRRSHLIFLALSKQEVSPVSTLYFLDRFCNVLRDYCGTLNETSICNNMTLLHELINSCLENGYYQTLNTDQLRSSVFTDPVIPVTAHQSGPLGEKKIVPGSSADKPVIKLRQATSNPLPEIYVDVIESIIAHFRTDGTIRKFELHGTVLVKSFIQNNHFLQVNVNEIIHLKKESDAYATEGALDYIFFDDRVDASQFAEDHFFRFDVTQGAMRVMTYAINSFIPNDLPFELTTSLKESDTASDYNFSLKLRCNIPRDSVVLNLIVHVPVPKSTRSIMQQISIEHCRSSFMQDDKEIVMKIEKFSSEDEVLAKFKLIGAFQNNWSKKEIGPVFLEFEISNFLSSKFAIKSVNAYYITNHPMNDCGKWIRHLSSSESYYYEV